MIGRDIDLEMAMRSTLPLGSVVEGVWKRKESPLKRSMGASSVFSTEQDFG